MSSLALISASNSGGGAVSRLSTVSARPPAWFRLNDMVAMLTPCSPNNVPIRPTMPGRSVFSSTSTTPCGRASTGRLLMLTIRGVAPKNAPATESVFAFRFGGELEQVGVIAGRTQARFGDVQA